MAGTAVAREVVAYDSSEELDLIRRASGTLNPVTKAYEGRDEAAFTELYNRTLLASVPSVTVC